MTGKCTVQVIDKAAKQEVDKAVEEAKASPVPREEDLWTDIYYKGTEPPVMRGREREEVRRVILFAKQTSLPNTVLIGSLQVHVY